MVKPSSMSINTIIIVNIMVEPDLEFFSGAGREAR
jgi:hypothetical protein